MIKFYCSLAIPTSASERTDRHGDMRTRIEMHVGDFEKKMHDMLERFAKMHSKWKSAAEQLQDMRLYVPLTQPAKEIFRITLSANASLELPEKIGFSVRQSLRNQNFTYVKCM